MFSVEVSCKLSKSKSKVIAMLSDTVSLSGNDLPFSSTQLNNSLHCDTTAMGLLTALYAGTTVFRGSRNFEPSRGISMFPRNFTEFEEIPQNDQIL